MVGVLPTFTLTINAKKPPVNLKIEALLITCKEIFICLITLPLAAIVMTRQLIILIGLLIFSGAVYGQTKRSSKYPPPPSLNDKNAECTKNHQFSPKDRLKNYPFNEADSVLIVSFDYSSADTTIFYKSGRLPIKADTLCYAGLSEKVILSVKQINSLTDILYNYDYIGKVEFEKNAWVLVK